MAFDLSKNDGSGKDSSGKPAGSSKFDLSKSEAEFPVIADTSPKPKTWIIGLVGVLIIGGGIWYFSSDTKTAGTAGGALTEVAASDSSAGAGNAGANTDAAKTGVQADVVVTDTTVATPSASPSAAGKPVAGNTVVSTGAGNAVAASVAADADASAALVPDAAVPVKTVPGKESAVVLNNKIPATFGQGSASFRRIDQSLIKRIISYLTKNPGASIHVNGYASSDGPLAINQTISQARADAFKKYLVSKNVAESRVVALGKGIENPIASNDSNAGRKKNRRVEIILP